MKRAVLVSCMLLISMASQAKSLTCQVSALTASATSGLMPLQNSFAMRAIIGDDKQCGTLKMLGNDLSLCAVESDIVGGYEAELMLSDARDYDPFDSVILLGTSKKTKQLVYLDGGSRFKASVLERLLAAGLDVEETDEGDSAVMDYAVIEGIKKGIVKDGEAVLFKIMDCKITE